MAHPRRAEHGASPAAVKFPMNSSNIAAPDRASLPVHGRAALKPLASLREFDQRTVAGGRPLGQAIVYTRRHRGAGELRERCIANHEPNIMQVVSLIWGVDQSVR